MPKPIESIGTIVTALEGDHVSMDAGWWQRDVETFSILGSHLSNAHQASEVVRLIDGGTLSVHPPTVEAWEELGEAHQAMDENRHAGTLSVGVGATGKLDAAHTAREVFEAWGSRFLDVGKVRANGVFARPC